MGLGGPVVLDVVLWMQGLFAEEAREGGEGRSFAELGIAAGFTPQVIAEHEAKEAAALAIGRRVIEDGADRSAIADGLAGEAALAPEQAG